MPPKGTRTSEEMKRRISEARRGYQMPEADRQHLSEVLRGRQVSEETRQRMRKPKSEETRVRMSIAARIRGASETYRATMSAAKRGKPKSEEHKRKLREYALAHPRHRYPDNGPSKLELLVQYEMTRQGLTFEPHVRFGPFVADIYLREYQTICEVDGSYWHNRPGTRTKDDRRDAWFAERGIRTIRLAESQIMMNVERCVQLVRKALE